MGSGRRREDAEGTKKEMATRRRPRKRLERRAKGEETEEGRYAATHWRKRGETGAGARNRGERIVARVVRRCRAGRVKHGGWK